MKKTKILSFLLSVLLITALYPLNFTVKAESITYMRVLKDSAIIYSDSNLTEALFQIPKTYYVKVENSLGSVYKVSYGNDDSGVPKIYGYMKQDDLTKASTEPSNPFYIIKVSTDKSDILFNDYELKNPYFNLPKNEVMYYYGDLKVEDNLLCYVYYSKKLGYVDKTCLNPFSVTPNQDPIESEQAPPTTEIETEQEINVSTSSLGENLQLIIIIGISVVSISVVYFLFKPSKNKTSEEQNEI